MGRQQKLYSAPEQETSQFAGRRARPPQSILFKLVYMCPLLGTYIPEALNPQTPKCHPNSQPDVSQPKPEPARLYG